MAIYIVFFWLHSTDDRGHLPVIIPAEVGGKVFCCYIFFGGPKMTPDTDSVETVLTRKPRGFPKVPWDFSHLRELMFFVWKLKRRADAALRLLSQFYVLVKKSWLLNEKKQIWELRRSYRLKFTAVENGLSFFFKFECCFNYFFLRGIYKN